MQVGTIKPISDTQRANYDGRQRKKTTQPHKEGSKRKLDKMNNLEFMVSGKIKKNAQDRSEQSQIQTRTSFGNAEN